MIFDSSYYDKERRFNPIKEQEEYEELKDLLFMGLFMGSISVSLFLIHFLLK